MNDEVFLGDSRDVIDEDRLLGRVPLPVEVDVLRVDPIGSGCDMHVELHFEWWLTGTRSTVQLDSDTASRLAAWITAALDDRTSAFTDEPDPLIVEDWEVGAA